MLGIIPGKAGLAVQVDDSVFGLCSMGLGPSPAVPGGQCGLALVSSVYTRYICQPFEVFSWFFLTHSYWETDD